MKILLPVLCSALIAGGCSSYRVRCDGRLKPINAPVPALATKSAAPAAANAPQGKTPPNKASHKTNLSQKDRS